MQTHEVPSTDERAAAIGDNIARLHDRIVEIATGAGRDPQNIQLHGATKGVEPERIIAAMQHGMTHFGENWVQEAAPKIEATNLLADKQERETPTWHMIGHLQRNKARQALELFQSIDTIDSLRLAETISTRAASMDIGRIDALLEVDFTDNPDRVGFKLPLESDESVFTTFADDARRIMELPNLNVIGLMTVGPMAENPETSRPAFRRLRELRDTLNDLQPSAQLTELSMGMTNDFHIAIQEGATVIRLGTAIFGPRPAGRTY